MYRIIKHYCISPNITNSSAFDVIEIKFDPPYKYITINGETKKYLI